MKERTQETAIVPSTQPTAEVIPERTARLVEKSFAETQFAERSAIARFKDGKSR